MSDTNVTHLPFNPFDALVQLAAINSSVELSFRHTYKFVEIYIRVGRWDHVIILPHVAVENHAINIAHFQYEWNGVVEQLKNMNNNEPKP